MRARSKLAGVAILIGVPLLVAILWIVSGHGMFTQARRIVGIPVRDELFGGTSTELRFVPGPVFGYYVGVDFLLLTIVAAAAGGTAWWLISRRRGRRAREGSAHAD